MAGNVLTGKVVITAPGVEATFTKIAEGVNRTGVAMTKLQTQVAAFGGGINKFSSSFAPVPQVLDRTGAALNRVSSTSSAATQSLINLSRVAQDAPYGFLGIANNLNPLLESFQRLKASTGTTGGALKALGKELSGAGGLGLALGVVSSLLVVFGDKLFGVNKEAEKTKSATDALRESISGVFKEVAQEATQVASLIAVLKSETETRERRLSAIKELQKIQPEIFAGLKLEGNAVVGLDNAYKNYLANLQNVIAAKIIQARLEQKIEKLLRLQGVAATESEKKLLNAFKTINQERVKLAQGGDRALLQNIVDLPDKKIKEQSDRIKSDINGLFKDLQEFSKSIKVPDLNLDKIKPNTLKVKPKKIEIDLPEIGSIDLELPTVFDKPDVSKFKSQLNKIEQEITLKIPIGLDLSIPQKGIQADIKKAQAAADALKAPFITLSNDINAALSTAFAGAFESLGEGLGNILSGNDFGKQFAAVFGNLFNTIGKALIKFGIVKEGIDKILGPGGIVIPGGLAIGLGVFAIAAGQLLKNISGTRAKGGPVEGGGTYLVGEKGPELFTPRVSGQIHTAEKTRELLGSIPRRQFGGSVIAGTSYLAGERGAELFTPNTGNNIFGNNLTGASGSFSKGGIAVQVTGEFLQRGQDLLAVLTLANQSKLRLV